MPHSYHTHTAWSDGETSPRALWEEAARRGLAELGISDHLALHPAFPDLAWSMMPGELPAYLAELADLQALAAQSEAAPATGAAPGPQLRVGLEVDFIPATHDQLVPLLAAHAFDFLIGSVHFVGDFPIEAPPQVWQTLSESARNDIWRGYWQAIRGLAESRMFDIVGHLDYPKKFTPPPTVDLRHEIAAALDAIAAADLVLELNTNGWDSPAAEAYPAPALLEAVRHRGIPLLISADAHRPADLTRHFERAEALARAVGYRETVRFAGRRRHTVPL
jgi:histidinol-phosphatase (PHP family)